jgi:hypothetical protein
VFRPDWQSEPGCDPRAEQVFRGLLTAMPGSTACPAARPSFTGRQTGEPDGRMVSVLTSTPGGWLSAQTMESAT